jgi:glycine reductase
VAIPHPVGDPKLPKGEEIELRKKLLRTALIGLSSRIQEQTVFKSEDLSTKKK